MVNLVFIPAIAEDSHGTALEDEKPSHVSHEEEKDETPSKGAPKGTDPEKSSGGSSSWAALAARAAPLQPQPHARPPASAQKKPKPQQQQQQQQQQQDEDHEQRPPPAGAHQLYVSNLPFSSTKSQIDAIFGVYGEIKATALPTNKGYAFIDYSSPESVAKAVAATTAQPVMPLPSLPSSRC